MGDALQLEGAAFADGLESEKKRVHGVDVEQVHHVRVGVLCEMTQHNLHPAYLYLFSIVGLVETNSKSGSNRFKIRSNPIQN